MRQGCSVILLIFAVAFVIGSIGEACGDTEERERERAAERREAKKKAAEREAERERVTQKIGPHAASLVRSLGYPCGYVTEARYGMFSDDKIHLTCDGGRRRYEIKNISYGPAGIRVCINECKD